MTVSWVVESDGVRFEVGWGERGKGLKKRNVDLESSYPIHEEYKRLKNGHM